MTHLITIVARPVLLAFWAWLLIGEKRRKRAASALRDLLSPIGLPDWVKFPSFGLWVLLFATLTLGFLFAFSTALYVLHGANTNDSFIQLRGALLTVAAITAALGAVVALPFTIVRVLATERQTKVAESNLTTDLINKAVEGLGAEKTVSRIGRPVTIPDELYGTHTGIQWQGAPPPAGLRPEFGDWQTFNVSEPNLEVRIGAILTLERIARENLEEHVRVMEILCAYIRENAPASDAQPNPLGDFPVYPEEPTAEDLKNRQKMRRDRRNQLKNWVQDLRGDHAPRTDIQTALEVIGRRTSEQTAHEGKRDAKGKWSGYRLDLRNANLQAADLEHRLDRAMRFDRARLEGGRMEGAVLQGARIERAVLWKARMEGANLGEAHMKGAVLWDARMEGADLRLAQMEVADLSGAQMEGADIRLARMEGADLGGARMEGADLGKAKMERADFTRAWMVGANLRGARTEGTVLGLANLQSTGWAGDETGAVAHSADLRGAEGLTQAQLDRMVGGENTLLPETLADGSVPSIPAYWPAPGPEFFETMIAGMADRSFGKVTVEALRADFLCPEGEEPERTGSPLALDAPYPDGHPLAGRDD